MPTERRPLPRGAMTVLSRALVLLLSARTAFGEEVPPLDEVPPVDSANFTAIRLTRFACNPTMGFMYLDGEQQAVADELNCTSSDLVNTTSALPPVVGATCPAGFECLPMELGLPCGQGQCRPCSHGMYCPADKGPSPPPPPPSSLPISPPDASAFTRATL